MIRDGGGGRRRAYAKVMSSAFCLLLISALMVGCNLDSPSSPNAPGDLTGQTTNQSFTFSGTIGVSRVTGTITADDASTVTITATVRDASGNPVPNLTNITFSADLGGFVVGVDGQGNNVTATVASASTFNGQASVDFQSSGRLTGTAHITASLGQVSGSTTVKLEAAPVVGTIAASFGTDGTGAVTMTGEASAAVPLDVQISAVAIGDDGSTAIAGATVRFVIDTDTTDELTTNEPVEFLGRVDEVTTNTSGVAATQIRVQGPGDVIIYAELIDPNTHQVVATSNPIFLVTTQGTEVPTLTLAFDDDSTVVDLGGAGAATSVGVVATATDPGGAALAGYRVRFTIKSDTTGGAYLGSTAGTTTLTVTTSSSGAATITATLTTATQSVVIGAELLNASGTVIAVANSIIANYD